MRVKLLIILLLLVAGGLLVFSFLHVPQEDTDLDINEEVNSDQDILPAQNNGRENESINEVNENYSISGYYAPDSSIGSTEVNNFISDYIREFESLANEDVPDLRENQSAIGEYTLNIGYDSYESEKYIFHVVSFGEYTGGANANSVVYSFGFELSSGREVSLDDFVSESNREQFVSDLKRRLLEIDNLGGDTVGVFEDVVSGLAYEDISTFYVEDNKLVIVFSKYEVAPGAAGIIKVILENIYGN